jgi:MFS transporter, FHS family, L-fucose permease
MKNKSNFLVLLPIFFGFFVMGFVDVVGISTSYVQAQFNLSEQVSGFLPSMVFLWFLLLGIPTGSLMNKFGRKNTVLLSMAITFVGMILPFFTLNNLNIYVCYIAFALLGIGNAILQVSLNPLLSNVVKGNSLTSALTGGQVVKAVSSFCGPFIALFAATFLDNWLYLFPIFGGITLISLFWLFITPVEKEQPSSSSSISDAFKLLGNKKILLLFLGIIAVVGIDVGMNTVSGKLIMEFLGLDPLLKESVDKVSYVPSVYFACRTIGAFIGTALLVKMDSVKYFRIHIIIALLALILLFFFPSQIGLLILIGIVGYACSTIFSIIFSVSILSMPDKTNEISGLMVTGIVGGAILPPLMTWGTSVMGGNQDGALFVLLVAVVYLIFLAFNLKKSKPIVA